MWRRELCPRDSQAVMHYTRALCKLDFVDAYGSRNLDLCVILSLSFTSTCTIRVLSSAMRRDMIRVFERDFSVITRVKSAIRGLDSSECDFPR